MTIDKGSTVGSTVKPKAKGTALPRCTAVRRRHIRVVMLAGLASLLWLATSCTIELGDLGGGVAKAWGVNNAGVVVGESETAESTAAEPITHAFKRMPDTTMVDLGALPGHQYSVARRINDAGVAVGLSAANRSTIDSDPRAVLWADDGTILNIGPPGVWATAVDINESGMVVGNSASGAFVFDLSVGHAVLLPQLPNGIRAVVNGMNNLGQAVGWQYVVDSAYLYPNAVIWDIGQHTVTDMNPTWGNNAFFIDINDSGTIAGAYLGTSIDPHAAIFRPGASAPESLTNGPSQPSTINEDDVVVGWRTDVNPGGSAQAFRWDPTSGAVSLAPGQVSEALDVNESDQVIGVADSRAVQFLS